MTRVVSKKLFAFEPLGQVNDEIRALEETSEMDKMKEELEVLFKKCDEEWLESTRQSMSGWATMVNANPLFKEGVDNTDITTLKVPTTHDGNVDVEVFVYTPKSLAGRKKRTAYIYAHGGGCIGSTASECESPFRKFAYDLNLVVFNVDYRLAPETKCPNNIKDFYSAVKYVSAHCAELGVDPTQIVIAGDSGGGYIVCGAMVLLAEQGEGNLVKLAIPGVPMVSDYHFSDTGGMTTEEKDASLFMRRVWRLIADDLETQRSSPHLFPGHATDELLAKFPPTIFVEAEFDIYITETLRFASRVRRAGRLLELVLVPGENHGSLFMPGAEGFIKLAEIYKIINKEYIQGDIEFK